MVKRKAIATLLPLTAGNEEGTFYKHGSPERKNIAEPGTRGEKLVLKGHVLDKGSGPVPHAWLDFWQADGRGLYDNEGFNLRGHQYTDHESAFQLETVRPMGYGGRAAHINVKVRANKNTPVLTTQLFFADDPDSRYDPVYNEKTVVDLTDIKGGQEANFDFVIET